MSAELNQEVRAFTKAVWGAEPEDLRRLRAASLPPGGRWSGVLFCNLLLLWSGQIIMSFRSLAKGGTVPADALAAVTAAHVRQLADWLAHWQMDDTVRLLRRVGERLEAGDVKSAADLSTLIEELAVALNRVQNWIDAFVPWSTFDAKLPPLDRDTAPGAVKR